MRLRRVLRGFGPAIPPARGVEALRATLGGIGGLVALTALAALAVQGGGFALPLGASAVLIFALPNSPLAQPWSVVVGNAVAAFAGVAVGSLVPDPMLAPAIAFGVALPAMMLARALHPPGGAMAATAAMAVHVAGVGVLWPLWPVAFESLILVLVGIGWARATGRVYPFRQPPLRSRHATADVAPDRRFGLDPAHLSRLLRDFRQTANIGVEDLARIIEAAESDAAARRFGGLTCDMVMSRNVVTLTPEAPATSIVEAVDRHGFTSFPVVDGDRLVGIVSQSDLIRRAIATGREGATVGAIMTAPVRVLDAQAPVALLLPLLSEGGVSAVPILQDDRLAGIVTRSDLVALLAHELALGQGA